MSNKMKKTVIYLIVASFVVSILVPIITLAMN